jgi:antitoxin component of MazEF toxin-antitoxin module
MEVVTVRRVGNSNVITLPHSLEASGYRPGVRVVVDSLPTGEIVIRPVESVRARLREIGREVIRENQGALDALEAYDQGQSTDQPIRYRPR